MTNIKRKKQAPFSRRRITRDEYLAQVEPAVRYLFDGIGSYIDRFKRLRWPSQARTKDELAESMKELESWMAGEFSLAVLCGSVLQLAAQGLKLCSHNAVIPPSCSAFASAEHAPFCVGRELYGLPLGVFVCAGRHQFAHWEDERRIDEAGRVGFSPFVEAVFNTLLYAHRHDPLKDMVYDLGNDFYGGTPIRSDSLMLEDMGWTTYELYLADMREMLR
jgi:hypothetical protein